MTEPQSRKDEVQMSIETTQDVGAASRPSRCYVSDEVFLRELRAIVFAPAPDSNNSSTTEFTISDVLRIRSRVFAQRAVFEWLEKMSDGET